MIIAQQKIKENIAEYLLYMYQVEDLIRAHKFDITAIDQQVIAQFDTDYNTKREMLEWYKSLIHELISEKKEKSGHIIRLTEITDSLHEQLLKILHEPLNEDIKNAWDKAKPNIDALRQRSGHSNENDIQLALNGLYGLLILRIQQKEITPETKEAFQSISEFIALLSASYQHPRNEGTP